MFVIIVSLKKSLKVDNFTFILKNHRKMKIKNMIILYLNILSILF